MYLIRSFAVLYPLVKYQENLNFGLSRKKKEIQINQDDNLIKQYATFESQYTTVSHKSLIPGSPKVEASEQQWHEIQP
jgi:hypothetical protein